METTYKTSECSYILKDGTMLAKGNSSLFKNDAIEIIKKEDFESELKYTSSPTSAQLKVIRKIAHSNDFLNLIKVDKNGKKISNKEIKTKNLIKNNFEDLKEEFLLATKGEHVIGGNKKIQIFESPLKPKEFDAVAEKYKFKIIRMIADNKTKKVYIFSPSLLHNEAEKAIRTDKDNDLSNDLLFCSAAYVPYKKEGAGKWAAFGADYKIDSREVEKFKWIKNKEGIILTETNLNKSSVSPSKFGKVDINKLLDIFTKVN